MLKNEAKRLIEKHQPIEPITHRLRQKTTIRTEKKKTATIKIANKFRKHIESQMEYKKVFGEDKSIKKFGLNLSIYDFKTLKGIYSMIKEKLISEAKKTLVINGMVNCKMLLGVNSTCVRIRPADKHEPAFIVI